MTRTSTIIFYGVFSLCLFFLECTRAWTNAPLPHLSLSPLRSFSCQREDTRHYHLSPLVQRSSANMAVGRAGAAFPLTRVHAAGNNKEQEKSKQGVQDNNNNEGVLKEQEQLQQELEMMMMNITGNSAAAADEEEYESVIPIPPFTAAVILMGSLYVMGYGFYIGLMGFPDD